MDSFDEKSKFDQMIYELLEQYEVLSSDELEELRKKWQEFGSLIGTDFFSSQKDQIFNSILSADYYSERGCDLELIRAGLENELKTGERFTSFIAPHIESYEHRHKLGNASSKSFKPGQILSARVVGRQPGGYTIVELSTKMHGFLSTESKHDKGEELKVHFVGWDQGTLLVTEKFVVESQDIDEETENAGNVIPFRRKENPPDPDEA